MHHVHLLPNPDHCLRFHLHFPMLAAVPLHPDRYHQYQMPSPHSVLHQRNLPDHEVLNLHSQYKIHHLIYFEDVRKAILTNNRFRFRISAVCFVDWKWFLCIGFLKRRAWSSLCFWWSKQSRKGSSWGTYTRESHILWNLPLLWSSPNNHWCGGERQGGTDNQKRMIRCISFYDL